MKNDLDRAALEYHRLPKPGKLEITPTKPLGTQRDLALAYSPGVAAACTAIVEDTAQAAELTARGHLIGEIGRASCRGRVCRQVSITVVTVPLNTNKHNPIPTN